MRIEFDVFGRPQGKQRPRMTRLGTVYTPKVTKDYEKLVKQCAIKAMKEQNIPKLHGLLNVKINAYFKIPKSASKKQLELINSGIIRPKLIDCDNIAKIILDGLNDLLYNDDRQVVDLYVSKNYSDNELVSIKIEELSSDDEMQ